MGNHSSCLKIRKRVFIIKTCTTLLYVCVRIIWTRARARHRISSGVREIRTMRGACIRTCFKIGRRVMCFSNVSRRKPSDLFSDHGRMVWCPGGYWFSPRPPPPSPPCRNGSVQRMLNAGNARPV